jgi:hypothetical protein
MAPQPKPHFIRGLVKCLRVSLAASAPQRQ